jgi:hypothetical protein
MLDRAGRSNELFRFSTTALQWEQLDMCPDPEIVIVCVPNDWADSWGDDCEAYAANPDWCGYEESSDNCCVCGAGQETKSCEPAPSARRFYTMAAVGSDIFVFGGETDQGEEARCACWPPSGDMSDIAPAIAPRTAAVCARPHGLERGCCAWRHPGLVVTHGTAQPFLRWHRASHRAHYDEHVHNEASRATWCTGGAT